MNRLQHLFLLLAEEASEVAQNSSKCIRFTHTHQGPQYSSNNLERLQVELRDMFSVLSLLEQHLGILFDHTPDPEKVKRIEKYMQISVDLGTLKI